jgi:hypothetical protein
MNKALLSIIPATVNIVKLLPVLFLFTGFQGHAAPITTIGNLSYDGTLISGDGRTYLGFDTLVSKTYQETLDLTAPGQHYANYRIANTEDADYFIDSIFGDTADACSNHNGTLDFEVICGNIPGWKDAAYGSSLDDDLDMFFFIADEHYNDQMAGFLRLKPNGEFAQNEGWTTIDGTDEYSESGGNSRGNISWLLVTDSASTTHVHTPPSFAIFVLGLAGIGFARRRRS